MAALALQLAAPALIAFLYGRRALRLTRRGAPVPALRRLSFALGLVLYLVAVSPPLERLGEERLFAAHMLQHVVLGDLAALFLVLGLTGPMLRPVLALPVVGRLRVLAHPLVALPLWAANLYLWHLPVLYEGAIRHDALHALEHACFLGFGMLMWAAVVEVVPGPAWFGTGWKLAYVVVVRLLETVLGNVFFWWGAPLYDTYAQAPRIWGISPLADQGYAGGIMMVEGSLVTIAALAWLFLRLAREGELRQELLERGLDRRSVDRAVRYGRGQELSQGR
jgi:cytochrome c oxidase assembly factor CtaG